MSGFATAEANAFLNAYFRAASFTFPANLYWALSTTVIASDGTNLTEPSGNGYARLAIAAGSSWATASGRQITNAVDFVYPEATGSWGNIVNFAGMSASSGGVVKVFGALVTPVTITAPMVPVLFAGTMIVRSLVV